MPKRFWRYFIFFFVKAENPTCKNGFYKVHLMFLKYKIYIYFMQYLFRPNVNIDLRNVVSFF